MRRISDRNPFDIFKNFEDMFEEIKREVEITSPFERRNSAFFGYSMTRTPDGKIDVKTFGNPEDFKASFIGIPDISEQKKMGLSSGSRIVYPEEEEGEPFTDTIHDRENGKLIVTVEMPGVTKEDIKIKGKRGSIEISARRGDRKYHKKLELEVPVDMESAKATYNNGILEIKFDTKDSNYKDIKIE